MSEVEISVIMGVLNPAAPHHLHQAVRSILEQSFRNWEMILYDDGSDAASAREIQNVAAWDGRIRSYRSEQNRGLGYALNQCIRYARGRYLARMDADDVAAPNRLEQQLPGSIFMRCQRSFVINLIHVREAVGNSLLLSNGTEVPISRGSKAAVLDSYRRFCQLRYGT